MRTTRWIGGAVSSVATLWLGCLFSPQVDWVSCMVGCDDGAPCPGSDLECKPGRDGHAYCVAPTFYGSCGAEAPAAGVEDPTTPVMPVLPGVVAPSDPPRTTADVCRRSGEVSIEPCPLPPPCAGVPYRFQLRLPSSTASAVWRVSSDPSADLVIERETGLLSGTLTVPTRLTVSVEDGASRGQAEYVLEPRTSCWFAYVSSDVEGARVHLVDPILLEQAPHHDLPEALPTGTRVVDFRFSPDGRWLAVRVDDGDARHIELFEAPRWDPVGAADGGGSVLEYAWAPDDPVLALAAQTPAGSVLSGVRLRATADVGDAGAVPRLAPLEPVATAIDSPLVWFGGGGIAFHAPRADAPELRRLYTGVLGAQQFTGVGPFEYASYNMAPPATLALVPSGNQVIAILKRETTNQINSYQPTNEGAEQIGEFRDGAVASPGGEYLARAQDGQLEIYLASDTRPPLLPFVPPVATAPHCSRVLAWSADGSRVACVSEGDERGSLFIFALAAASSPTAALIEGDYEYPDQLQGRRRAFAPGGRWFAFANNYGLYTVDLSQTNLQVRSSTRLDSVNSASDLIVSPDGESIVVQAGRSLTLRPLASIDDEVAVTDEMLDQASPCREDEAWAAGDACGTARTRSSRVLWSPDSKAIVLQTASNELQVFHPHISTSPQRISSACDSSCIDSSDFQPLSSNGGD